MDGVSHLYFYRGNIYIKTDLDQALSEYNLAIQYDAKYANAYYNRGLVYKEKGDNRKAIDDFNSFLQNPSHDLPSIAQAKQWLNELTGQ